MIQLAFKYWKTMFWYFFIWKENREDIWHSHFTQILIPTGFIKLQKLQSYRKMSQNSSKAKRLWNDSGRSHGSIEVRTVQQLMWKTGLRFQYSQSPTTQQLSVKDDTFKTWKWKSCWRPQANSRKGHKNNTQTLTVLNIIYKKITNDIRLSGLHSIHREGPRSKGWRSPDDESEGTKIRILSPVSEKTLTMSIMQFPRIALLIRMQCSNKLLREDL